VVFIDTAGLREAHDELETRGDSSESRIAGAGPEFILQRAGRFDPLTTSDEKYLAEFVGKSNSLCGTKLICR